MSIIKYFHLALNSSFIDLNYVNFISGVTI